MQLVILWNSCGIGDEVDVMVHMCVNTDNFFNTTDFIEIHSAVPSAKTCYSNEFSIAVSCSKQWSARIARASIFSWGVSGAQLSIHTIPAERWQPLLALLPADRFQVNLLKGRCRPTPGCRSQPPSERADRLVIAHIVPIDFNRSEIHRICQLNHCYIVRLRP
ncbi:hypothetical protein AYI69_g4194 [Smittium culicis]|uniref:Uncharacterized protein n=1 Tax=Smittium culicis TaxID=133412 RepID=A0A1R1YFN7_9FUNG|nr:hypothetical protein AYI69_g4194 [Smittium culicis]